MHNNELFFYPSRLKLILSTLGALIFVVAGYIIIFEWSEDDLFGIFAGVVGIVFFGYCSIYSVYKLINWRPALLVNERGFQDIYSLNSPFVEWSNVESFQIYKYNKQRLLGVKLHDKNLIRTKTNVFKQMLINLESKFLPYQISFPQIRFRVRLEIILEQFELYKKNHDVLSIIQD